MDKLYFFGMRIWEQAERYHEKLAYWISCESENYTEEEYNTLVKEKNEISEALNNIRGSFGAPRAPWKSIQILKKAAAKRDILDFEIEVKRNFEGR